MDDRWKMEMGLERGKSRGERGWNIDTSRYLLLSGTTQKIRKREKSGFRK